MARVQYGAECLSEQVGLHLRGWKVRNLDETTGNVVADVMMPDVDVLGALVVASSSSDSNGGLRVGPDGYVTDIEVQYLLEPHVNPAHLLQGGRQGHVFGFGGGEGNGSLLLRQPGNGGPETLDDSTSGALAVLLVATPVTIA